MVKKGVKNGLKFELIFLRKYREKVSTNNS